MELLDQISWKFHRFMFKINIVLILSNFVIQLYLFWCYLIIMQHCWQNVIMPQTQIKQLKPCNETVLKTQHKNATDTIWWNKIWWKPLLTNMIDYGELEEQNKRTKLKNTWFHVARGNLGNRSDQIF